MKEIVKKGINLRTILKEGIIVCPNCGCCFKITDEEEDTVNLFDGRVVTVCPNSTCKYNITIRYKNKKQMSRLSPRKYIIWDNSDSCIDVERRGYHIVASREMCTDNWVIRFYEKGNFNQSFIKEEHKQVSANFIRDRIEEFFNNLKPKKKKK